MKSELEILKEVKELFNNDHQIINPFYGYRLLCNKIIELEKYASEELLIEKSKNIL